MNSYNHIKHLFKPSFISSKNSSVSLDIGSAYVKAISLEQNEQSIEITGFGWEKVGTDLKAAIKRALFKLPIKKKELAVSVSGQSVVLRYVNMPIMSREEVAKAMSFELEKYIPFNKEEINFDFDILNRNKGTGKMLVLIAAAKKDLITKRMEVCQELGYRPSFIDVCPLAAANYFEFDNEFKEHQIGALVNLGASITSVDIIEEGRLALSRDIFIGGNDFTKKISEALNKSFEESEEIKLNSFNDDLALSTESVYNSLVKELKVSFDFYETQANRSIERILLTGGAAQLQGLVDNLKNLLGQDVELAVFKPNQLKLRDSLNAEDFKNKFNFFPIALGMGLREFK